MALLAIVVAKRFLVALPAIVVKLAAPLRCPLVLSYPRNLLDMQPLQGSPIIRSKLQSPVEKLLAVISAQSRLLLL